MSYIAIIGLTASVQELLVLDAEKIETHAHSLASLLTENLNGTGWAPFRPITDTAASAHIITLENPAGDVSHTLDALRAAHIVCGSRNGRIRVSIAHFNNQDDMLALLRILQKTKSG